MNKDPNNNDEHDVNGHFAGKNSALHCPAVQTNYLGFLTASHANEEFLHKYLFSKQEPGFCLKKLIQQLIEIFINSGPILYTSFVNMCNVNFKSTAFK